MALIAKTKVSTRDEKGKLKVYEKGEQIKNLDSEEAKRLVGLGGAVFMKNFETDQDPDEGGENSNELSFEGIEIDELKEAAKEAGITFNPNIGLEKLIERIKEEEKTEAVLSQFDDGDE